jgi:hypothetical protein
MLCRHGRSGGCFAAVVLALADALPPYSCRFLVDALPPRPHLLGWQPYVDVFFLQVQSIRFVVEGPSLPPFFLLVIVQFLTTSSVVCNLHYGIFWDLIAALCKPFFRLFFLMKNA